MRRGPRRHGLAAAPTIKHLRSRHARKCATHATTAPAGDIAKKIHRDGPKKKCRASICLNEAQVAGAAHAQGCAGRS
jgi:hypothetical protein